MITAKSSTVLGKQAAKLRDLKVEVRQILSRYDYPSLRIFTYLIRCGKEGCCIVIKFSLVVWIPDIVTHAHFGDDGQGFLRERGSNFPLFH